MVETFYCEFDDVKGVGVSEEKLIQLTDGADSYDAEIFDTARRAATAQINGFALTRYSGKIPFNPVPDAVRTIAAILTKYYLYQRKNAVGEDVQKAYDDQVALLKMLSAGSFRLEQEDSPVSEDPVEFTDKSPGDRAFHISNLPGFLP